MISGIYTLELLFTYYFNLSNNRNIIVDNGDTILVLRCSHAFLLHPHPSFYLNNILYASQIIKNILCV